MTISMLVGFFALLAAGEQADRCLPRITPDLREQLAAEYAGHRLPRGSDQDEYNVTYNLQQGGSGCLGVASGDFDGDKQVDTALLLPAKSGDVTLVVVALRRGARWTLEQIDEWEGSAARYYVAVAPPGVYESPFYGESPPRPSEQATIKSSTDGVVTGQLESTALYYFRRNGKWQFVWVED